MGTESTVSPILAVGSIGIIFAALLLLIAVEAPALEGLRSLVFGHAQKAMMAVAVLATAGSLYYSEVVGFIPCEFCWYQRIAMYPLAALLTVAALTRGRLEPKYLMVLAVGGLAVSIYHFQLQLFPEQSAICTGPISCAGKNVEEFGLVTIPFMAGASFLTIILLQVAEWRVDRLFRRWDAEQAQEGDARFATSGA